MKQLMDVLEKDSESSESYSKYFNYISEPKTLEKIRKKKCGRRGLQASIKYQEKKIELKKQKKVRRIFLKKQILLQEMMKMKAMKKMKEMKKMNTLVMKL